MNFNSPISKILIVLSALFVLHCGDDSAGSSGKSGGMGSLNDGVSQKTVVAIAIESKDHTTLVKAVQAADLVDSLANPGPFTVFAPIDSAFDALPSGVVSDLMKSSNKGKLEDILYHHVFVGNLKEEALAAMAGEDLNMFSGGPVKIEVVNGKLTIDGAKVLGIAPASNGIVYVVDKVLLPKE